MSVDNKIQSFTVNLSGDEFKRINIVSRWCANKV